MPGGFYWTANSPYIRGAWVRVRRSSKTFDYLPADLAVIMSPDGTRKNSNPAHMIFECMTNTDWGEGSSPLGIDVPSFLRCAQTLYDEKFGLSMLWVRQDTIENFVGEILDHIQGYVYLDPRTGLRTLKLLRGDYDADTLEVFDADNSTLSKFSRKGYGETINEIVVSWTNPVNEQEETVTVQDLANIVSQGGQIVSDPRRYYGARDADLAVMLGSRDLRVAAAPLATGELLVDRSAWSKTPGDVVKINFPSRKIYNMIVRIGEIDYGSADDGRVVISFTQDIFGLESSIYVAPPGSGWIDPSSPPAPMSFQRVFNLPAFLITNYVNDATYSVELTYPEVAAGILAASSNPGTVSYELVGALTLANGGTVQTSLGTRAVLGHAETVEALPAEAVSLVESFTSFVGTAPLLAGFVLFDGGDDQDDEIALVQAIAEEGFTLYRGVLDTIPRPWPAGTKVWFLNLEQPFADEIVRSAGETVTYRLLTRTDQGLLAFEDAPPLTGTLNERPHLPNRPANVAVAGTHFGSVALEGDGPFAVTWATRNRLMETSQIVPWTYSSVTPEVGQTTTVEVLRPDGSVAFTADGLGGDSYNLAAASLGDLTQGFVQVSSKRDDFESLQGFRVPFTRSAPPPPPPAFPPTLNKVSVTEAPAGTFTKNTASTDWDASFYSNETYTGDVSISWKAGRTDNDAMVGLSTDPSTSARYENITFALYMNNGSVLVFINGGYHGTFGSFVAGDSFKVSRNTASGRVLFIKNGETLYDFGPYGDDALGFDSSFAGSTSVVTDVAMARSV